MGGDRDFCLEKVRKITVLEITIAVAVAKTRPCEHIPEDIVAPRPDRKKTVRRRPPRKEVVALDLFVRRNKKVVMLCANISTKEVQGEVG